MNTTLPAVGDRFSFLYTEDGKTEKVFYTVTDVDAEHVWWKFDDSRYPHQMTHSVWMENKSNRKQETRP
jgi:hypothetical protein